MGDTQLNMTFEDTPIGDLFASNQPGQQTPPPKPGDPGQSPHQPEHKPADKPKQEPGEDDDDNDNDDGDEKRSR